MRRSAHLFALAVLAAILLVANGYPALMAYTLLAGPRVTAEVTACSDNSRGSTSCSGRWRTPDGEEDSGDITGAVGSDLGGQVVIRTGPLGAYTDNIAHLVVRSIFSVAFDAGVVAVVVMRRRIRRHGPAAVARLKAGAGSARLFTVGGGRIGVLDGAGLFTVEDTSRSSMRFLDGSGVERWRLRGEKRGSGIREMVLTDPSDKVAGYIRRTGLLDAAGNQLATVTYPRIHGVPGLRFRAPTGGELGLGVSTRDATVVRLDENAPDVLPLLVFAYIEGSGWLSLPG